MLLFTLEHESEIDSVLEQMLQYQVDGIVTAAMLNREQLALIDEAGIPVALYNRRSRDGLASAVRCDQEEGERWLVTQLVEAGHRRFAIISGPEDSTVSVERTSSAVQKLAELGIQDVTVVGGDYSYQSGRLGFAAIAKQLGEPPDAVIAANDVMAIGCIDAARQECNLAVPEALSVVGFDGVGPARYAAYNLTTVQQPVERMTQATVAMLLERIKDPQLPPEERIFAGTKVAGGLRPPANLAANPFPLNRAPEPRRNPHASKHRPHPHHPCREPAALQGGHRRSVRPRARRTPAQCGVRHRRGGKRRGGATGAGWGGGGQRRRDEQN